MPAINLLPTELKPKGYILKFSKTFTSLAVAGLVLFLFSGVILTGAFLIISRKLNDSFSRQQELKNQIKAYQRTEQSLLLVKDRLSKINKIYTSPNSKEEIGILDEVLSILPEGVTLQDTKLFPDEAEISFILGDSYRFSQLLSNLTDRNLKKVELASFALKPDQGYEVKLNLMR